MLFKYADGTFIDVIPVQDSHRVVTFGSVNFVPGLINYFLVNGKKYVIFNDDEGDYLEINGRKARPA